MGVFDAHDAFAFDASDAPGRRAQQEDVAGVALDREVFVDRADEGAVRLLDDAEVAGFGNHAAVEQRGQAGGASRAQHLVDAVAMDQRTRASAALADAGGEHLDGRFVGLAVEFAVGRGVPELVVKIALIGGLGGDLGDDLLGEHLDRGDGLGDAVERARGDGADHCGALDQLIERRGEQRAVGDASERVAGAADALQEGADPARRADLADQVDRADVDPELERGGGDHRLEVARLEPLLHLVAPLLGEAAVVAGDVLLTDALGQPVRDALGQRAGVDEDQRGPMLRDQLAEAVIDAVPQVVGGDRGERDVGRFDPELQLPLVAEVEHLAVEWLAVVVEPGEEGGDLVHRLLGGGEPDPHGPLLGDVVEAGE